MKILLNLGVQDLIIQNVKFHIKFLVRVDGSTHGDEDRHGIGLGAGVRDCYRDVVIATIIS